MSNNIHNNVIDLTDHSPTTHDPDNQHVDVVDLEPTVEELEADEQRLEILPVWLRSWSAFRSTATAAVGRQLHRFVYHVTHLPVYYWRVIRRAPLGLWRMLVFAARWAADRTERADEVREAVIADKRSNVAYNYSIDHRRAIGAHTIAVLVALVAIVITAWIAVVRLTEVELAGLAAVILLGLGLVGRDWSTPVVDTAVKVHKTLPLTPDLIIAGIAAVNHSGINKAVSKAEQMAAKGRPVAPPIALVDPVKQTRTGAGYATRVLLPSGVPADEVVPKGRAFASAIGRPVDTVFLTADPEDDGGVLSVFVANRSLRKTKPRTWPLLTKGRTNFFADIPCGVDVRGEAVGISWHEKSAVIGAIPGMGKSVCLMTVFAGFALDPRVRIYLHFKGGKDGKPFQRVAHYWRSGDDPDDIKALRDVIKDLVKEAKRRYQILAELDDDICPTGSVTDALASRRDLGLEPIAVGLDEVQSYYMDPEYGSEIEADVEYLVRKARQANIIVLQATQKPNDDSLPTNIRDNVAVRIGFHVKTRFAAEMTLGEGLSERGIRPHKDLTPADKGISWLLDEDAERLMRWDFIPLARLNEVLDRARTARERTGYLTGHAAGEDPNPDTDDSTFVDHVAQVWPTGRTWLWNSEIARLLAHGLDAYRGISTSEVGARLNTAGVPVRGLNRKNPTTGETSNSRGIEHTDLLDALDAQEAARNLDEVQASYDDHDHYHDGHQDPERTDTRPEVAEDIDRRRADTRVDIAPDTDEDIWEDTDEDMDPDVDQDTGADIHPALRIVDGGDLDAG